MDPDDGLLFELTGWETGDLVLRPGDVATREWAIANETILVFAIRNDLRNRDVALNRDGRGKVVSLIGRRLARIAPTGHVEILTVDGSHRFTCRA